MLLVDARRGVVTGHDEHFWPERLDLGQERVDRFEVPNLLLEEAGVSGGVRTLLVHVEEVVVGPLLLEQVDLGGTPRTSIPTIFATPRYIG